MLNSLKPELLIAAALYEVRLLLSSYLGSENTAEIRIRTAAHLAYAFQNEAEALLKGKPFQVGAALSRIEAIDRILGEETKLIERLTLHSRTAVGSTRN